MLPKVAHRLSSPITFDSSPQLEKDYTLKILVEM